MPVVSELFSWIRLSYRLSDAGIGSQVSGGDRNMEERGITALQSERS